MAQADSVGFLQLSFLPCPARLRRLPTMAKGSAAAARILNGKCSMNSGSTRVEGRVHLAVAVCGRKLETAHGFTLIELLVVMGIISLLAAMLLPVLQQAVLSARIAVCANNQRQMYLGAAMYGSDWADCVPLRYGDKCWNDLYYLQRADGGEIPPNIRGPRGIGLLYPQYVRDGGAYGCPGTDYRHYSVPTIRWWAARSVKSLAPDGTSGVLGGFHYYGPAATNWYLIRVPFPPLAQSWRYEKWSKRDPKYPLLADVFWGGDCFPRIDGIAHGWHGINIVSNAGNVWYLNNPMRIKLPPALWGTHPWYVGPPNNGQAVTHHTVVIRK